MSPSSQLVAPRIAPAWPGDGGGERVHRAQEPASAALLFFVGHRQAIVVAVVAAADHSWSSCSSATHRRSHTALLLLSVQLLLRVSKLTLQLQYLC